MAGVKGRSGRRPAAIEYDYLDAVRAGASPQDVKEATQAIIAKAKQGDARAYVAVVSRVVPELSDLSLNCSSNEYVAELRAALGLGPSPNLRGWSHDPETRNDA